MVYRHKSIMMTMSGRRERYKTCMLLLCMIIVQFFTTLFLLHQSLRARDLPMEGYSHRKISYPPYKIYVYELPDQFNKDLVKCLDNKTFFSDRLSHQGFGSHLFINSIMSIRQTWQFSLEQIVHNELLHSPYRTKNQKEAQVFYVPFYSGLSCFCEAPEIHGRKRSTLQDHDDFFNHLSTLRPYRDGKPHIMTLAKIEREHGEIEGCKLLSAEIVQNITFIGIEQETRVFVREILTTSDAPLIVAPYPSFGHLFSASTSNDIQKFFQQDQRENLILFAGRRMSYILVREKAIEGLTMLKTSLPYDEYMKEHNVLPYRGVHLDTSGRLEHIMSWLKHSVFCLQPAGDSPTRKSFYDSVLSGCIPVIFTSKPMVKYPFEDKIRYDKFTVTINRHDIIDEPESVFNILSAINSTTISEKQQYMYKVMKFLQYTFPILPGIRHDDAMKYILDEIGTRYNLGSPS